jgi:hypothetical protein
MAGRTEVSSGISKEQLVSIMAQFSFAKMGNTIPYPPCTERGRTNAGFVDLRGKPELVDHIHEAGKSPALTRLLRAMAASAYFMSLGCDLGDRERTTRGKTRYDAGGYVQFTSADLDGDYDYFKRLAEDAYEALFDASGRSDWRVRFEVGDVCYRADDDEIDNVSLWVWFDVSANSLQKAKTGRERLLDALADALFSSPPTRDLIRSMEELEVSS